MNSYLINIFSFWLATFVVWFILTPFFIKFLINFKLWKNIREKATIWKATKFFNLHKKKSWTPTMWGFIILWTVLMMIVISIILQKSGLINNSLFNQKETYLTIFTLITVWFLGWVDDYMNIRWIGRTKWLSARFKIIWLIILSLLGALWFYYKLKWGIRELHIPFYSEVKLWLWFIPLFMFIIIATSNSVNLSDWLDWLAWWLLLFCYVVYAYITYDQWLFLLSTLCVSIVWALVSFLWFNVKPAKFYMWDVWSLALWANLWLMALLTNTIVTLIIISILFIFETLSVIIQLTSKKLRKWKKVFRIAPFHHHLEAIWWKEETVVFRLWLIGMLLSVSWIIFYMIQK